MPLTEKGSEIMGNMTEQYGEEKGKSVFYASKNKGTIKGVDQQPIPNAGTPIAPSVPQQFGNSPSGMSQPTGGGAGSVGKTFTRGSDTVVASAKDLALAAGAKR